MPEEIEVETKELQESIAEMREERAKEARDTAWTRYISLSTAFLAVIAAVGALKAGGLVNEAILRKNEAVLKQAQASDQWAYYQSAGIKANMAQYFASLVANSASQGKQAARYRSDGQKYEGKKSALQEEAKALEAERDAANKEANELMQNHEDFALSVTFTQVAIALSAIAALTKRKNVWYFSMLVGVLGIIYFSKGYANTLHASAGSEQKIEQPTGKSEHPSTSGSLRHPTHFTGRGTFCHLG